MYPEKPRLHRTINEFYYQFARDLFPNCKVNETILVYASLKKDEDDIYSLYMIKKSDNEQYKKDFYFIRLYKEMKIDENFIPDWNYESDLSKIKWL